MLGGLRWAMGASAARHGALCMCLPAPTAQLPRSTPCTARLRPALALTPALPCLSRSPADPGHRRGLRAQGAGRGPAGRGAARVQPGRGDHGTAAGHGEGLGRGVERRGASSARKRGKDEAACRAGWLLRVRRKRQTAARGRATQSRLGQSSNPPARCPCHLTSYRCRRRACCVASAAARQCRQQSGAHRRARVNQAGPARAS